MGQPIHRAILEQAEAQPDAVALRQGHVSMTYAGVSDMSGALAVGLGQKGCGQGVVVGVCMPRCPELIVALLGVLRAGAAYLPLDPNDPPARLQMLLDDAGAAAVVTTAELATPLRLENSTFTFAELCEAPGGGLPEVTADHLAYVIFTSGSTGRPKGVAVPHGCVVAMIRSMEEHVRTGPGDVWLSLTSASFDVSVFEFFATLARGSTVEIADILGPSLFSTALARGESDITHLQATPTLLAGLLMDADSRRGIARLAHLTCTGEALAPELARELRSLLSGRFVNAYGPTEATVWAAIEAIGEPVEDTVSIGRPPTGQDVQVLGDDGVAVDEGTVGELFIGGSGVAWGYLGQPGLTAERFVPDPFSAQSGARMYRTGDLGYRLRDGRIVCLGRNDRQVKLKGHRIELDGVEHVLVGLDQVSAGCVILEGDTPNRQIVAIVVRAGQTDSREIRDAMAQALPAASVPSRVRFVDELARTNNGKVDRQAMGDQTGFGVQPERGEIEREVVVNQVGQHALWWAGSPPPNGWDRVGFVGSVETCRNEVNHRWPNIRPTDR